VTEPTIYRPQALAAYRRGYFQKRDWRWDVPGSAVAGVILLVAGLVGALLATGRNVSVSFPAVLTGRANRSCRGSEPCLAIVAGNGLFTAVAGSMGRQAVQLTYASSGAKVEVRPTEPPKTMRASVAIERLGLDPQLLAGEQEVTVMPVEMPNASRVTGVSSGTLEISGLRLLDVTVRRGPQNR
jgi:hypothetical protein